MTTTDPRAQSTGHLGWLYLLAIVPTLTDVLELGTFATTPRGYTTEVVMTILVLIVVNVIIRRSKALSREVEARIRSNEQLQHANRLAIVGQLAAGMAHELGSPLQVVAGRAKMVATGETTAAAALESGQIILEQAQRMTALIRGLLDFARRRPAQKTASDLQDVARRVHRILGPAATKKAVALELEIRQPATILIDMLQIEQALTNLVMNAIQAVPEGGHVSIIVERVCSSPPPDQHKLQRVLAHDIDCVRLRVTDDGPGISPEDRLRVFEPFFTTKDVGEGTGLGLSVAFGLVRESGGWITLESEPGHGASFSIIFPATGDGPS